MDTYVLAASLPNAVKLTERDKVSDGWKLANLETIAAMTDGTLIVADDYYVGRDGLSYDKLEAEITNAQARGVTVNKVDGTGATPFDK